MSRTRGRDVPDDDYGARPAVVADLRGDRYAGLADWYDTSASGSAESSRAELTSLLGPGQGRCLDLGCGTGQYIATIEATGRLAIGVDRSADQLRIARSRSTRVVQGDAARLPFADAAFSTVAALWVTTDVDELESAFAEAARVLAPGGRLLVYGVHPCFNGPLVENLADGSRTVHPGYREPAWYSSAPWWGADGIRSRLGMWHRPLADLFNMVIGAGFRIERVAEPRDEPIPFILAIVLTKEVAGA